MKVSRIILYVLAGFLLLIALLLLIQVFAARQAVQNMFFPYQVLLGGENPLLSALLASVLRAMQGFLLASFGLCLLLAGAAFGGARLLLRLERQKLRIQELESQLAAQEVEAGE